LLNAQTNNKNQITGNNKAKKESVFPVFEKSNKNEAVVYLRSKKLPGFNF